MKILLLAAIILSLSNCTLLKASSPKKTLFLTHPELVVETRDRAPFNGIAYIDPVRVDQMHAQIKKILVLPIRTDLLEKEFLTDIPDEQQRAQRIEEAKEIARYFHDRIIAAMKAYPNYPYEIIDKQTPDCFVLEFALVELEPTKIEYNMLGTVAGFFVPGAGAIGRAATGGIAFEAQIRDGSNNKVIIEFKDRETDKTSLFTVKDFEEYGHIRESIDEWAEQYAELSSTARTHRVSDSLPFTISPL
jgi:hypothetical protein